MPKRCPNCERSSWAKPAYLLTGQERKGLDSRGFDLRGRRRGLTILDPAAKREAGRTKRVREQLDRLLGKRD